MKHLTEDFQLVFHNRNALLNALKFLAFKVRVFFEGGIHILFYANIIDYQSLVLAFAYTVDTGNRLDQGMLLNRLVYVNRIQFGNIKAGQPHIHDNRNFEIRLRVFELAVKFLAVLLRAEHIKQVFLIILVASHYQFDFFHRL